MSNDLIPADNQRNHGTGRRPGVNDQQPEDIPFVETIDVEARTPDDKKVTMSQEEYDDIQRQLSELAIRRIRTPDLEGKAAALAKGEEELKFATRNLELDKKQLALSAKELELEKKGKGPLSKLVTAVGFSLFAAWVGSAAVDNYLTNPVERTMIDNGVPTQTQGNPKLACLKDAYTKTFDEAKKGSVSADALLTQWRNGIDKNVEPCKTLPGEIDSHVIKKMNASVVSAANGHHF